MAFQTEIGEKLPDSKIARQQVAWAKKKTESVVGKSKREIYKTLDRNSIAVVGEDEAGRKVFDVQFPHISASAPEEVIQTSKMAKRIWNKELRNAVRAELLIPDQAKRIELEGGAHIAFQNQAKKAFGRIERKNIASGGGKAPPPAKIWRVPRRAASGAKLLVVGGIVMSASSACVVPEVSPTSRPTEKSIAIEVAPTPEPTQSPEIATTPTTTWEGYPLPVNPPEYVPEAAGGVFPEGIREVAVIDKYRALLTLSRQEGETFLAATDGEYKTILDEFAQTHNLEVKQVWNDEFGDSYQMVSVVMKAADDGNNVVYWFATEGGALSARPDLPSEENSKFAMVPIPEGMHAEWRWGEDENIYMYAVDDETGEAIAWFNTTQADASSEESLNKSWIPIKPFRAKDGVVQEFANGQWQVVEVTMGFPGVVRVEQHGDVWVGLDEGGHPLWQSTDSTGTEWERFERKLGLVCDYVRSTGETPDCDSLTPEMLKPIDESQVKPIQFTDEHGQIVEIEDGRFPALDEDFYEEDGELTGQVRAVAGVIRGFVPWPYQGGPDSKAIKLYIEVRLSEFESQGLFYIIPDQSTFAPYLKVLDQEMSSNGVSYDHVAMQPREVLELFRANESTWINQQIIFQFITYSDRYDEQMTRDQTLIFETIESGVPADLKLFLMQSQLYVPRHLVPEDSIVEGS